MTTRSATKNSEHSRALTEELGQCMEERGLTQASVARAIGFSDSALSQWLGGKYKGDVKGVEHAITGFLQREWERAGSRKLQLRFVMTSTAAKVFEAARMCHLDGEIGVVVGAAGVGKTTAIKEYAARNSDVLLVEADLGYTARDLFAELHRKCGFDGLGSINRMKDEVIEKLRNSGRLIIIDEAEHLPVRALDLVRRINDKAGVGILFCGLQRFMENLRLRQADFAYLYTRVGFKVTLEGLHARDIETIVQDAVPGSNGLWKTYHEESHGNGRVLSKLVARSLRLAEMNGMEVTTEIVREAAKMLIV
jgi:DNA transposition AAA+ family ATPase